MYAKTSDKESNKLKKMKKFYPEEYFKRSGYPFESLSKARKKDLIYFKTKQNNQNDADFSRFNEELVYPKADARSNADTRSNLKRYDLDRLS